MTASSRNSVFYQQFLQQVEDANPTGEIWVVTDDLSSHNSLSTRIRLEDHARIRHAFILVGTCRLNLEERPAPRRRLVVSAVLAYSLPSWDVACQCSSWDTASRSVARTVRTSRSASAMDGPVRSCTLGIDSSGSGSSISRRPR
ncbi:hypothetical protein SANTM175S_09149 [Streptomyces antimycoticus]